jgi:hypothetical protein
VPGELSWSRSSDTPGFLPAAGILALLNVGRLVAAGARISVDVEIDSGTFSLGVMDSSGGINTSSQTYVDGLTESGTVEITAKFPWDTVAFLGIMKFADPPPRVSAGKVTKVEVTLEGFASRELVVIPPANKGTLLRVSGWWKPSPLVVNEDSNYWTREHPMLVAYSAQWIRDNVQLNFDTNTTIGRLLNETRRKLSNLDVKQEMIYHGKSL